MSSLGSANTSAQVAAPLKSAASDCPRNGLEVIVHPRFRRQLEEEPAVFCPLDWLPDEVISNVLVHLVSARLHPRTHHHRTPPNPRTLRLPPRTDTNTVFRTNVRSPPTHTQQNDSSISPLNPPSIFPLYPQNGRDVARFSLVNRRARRLCEDDEVWKELCARHFDIRPEGNDSPECGWCALYQIHHNVLYALFGDGGRQSPGFGSADGFGRGMGAIAQGRAGGMSISLGAA